VEQCSERDREIQTQFGIVSAWYNVPVSACINTLNGFNVLSALNSDVRGPQFYDIVWLRSADIPQGRQTRGARHNLGKEYMQSVIERFGSELMRCS
jgi:hypothetical protein